MIIDTDNLPDPDDVTACAEYKATHQAAIGYLYSWNMRVTKLLKAEIKEREGLPIGSIGMVRADGYEYSVRIADEMPQFGKNVISFVLACEHNPGRILDVLIEAMPELEDEIRSKWKVVTEVDKGMVSGWIKAHRDGPISERLRELRTQKKELGKER